MNFQEKVFEASAQLRARAAALASAAIETAKARAISANRRVEGVRHSVGVLNDAGRQLSKVARLHARRFVKHNAPLMSAARKDVSALARATLASLTPAQAKKTVRKAATSRKRPRKAA